MATISIFLNKSKIRKDRTYPISVRLTVGNKRRYIPISTQERFSCTTAQITANGDIKQNHPQYAKINSLIADLRKKYADGISKFEKFHDGQIDIDKLIEEVREDIDARKVMEYFAVVAKDLTKKKKIRNARTYQDTAHLFARYLSKKYNDEAEKLKKKPKEKPHFPKSSDIFFSQLTPKKLEGFSDFLSSRGVSDNTKSHYFRTIRALYNRAIADNFAMANDYPFCRTKYDKKFSLAQFNTETTRRAMAKEDLLKLFSIDVTNDKQYNILAKHYAEFSYYGRGMNFIDFANLRWKDIQKDRIVYTRSKTGKEFSISIEPEMKEILDYWRVTKLSDTDFVFPVLDPRTHKSEKQRVDRIKKVRKLINKALKELAKKKGIKENITTYSIRHTFATTLKYSGVSIGKIRELMQHSSDRVTETYLKSFGDEELDKELHNLR